MSAAVADPSSEEEDAPPPISRMIIVVLALVGIFVAGYLTLHRFGFIGTLQCSLAGGCETVQSSAYAFFPPRTVVDWGISVALMGLIGYIVLFAIGILGIQPGRTDSVMVGRALFFLSGGALIFSLWLTYVEARVLHAWCQWCVISAMLITLIFLFSIPGYRATLDARRTPQQS